MPTYTYTQPSTVDVMDPNHTSAMGEKRPAHSQQYTQCHARRHWPTGVHPDDSECCKSQQNRFHGSRLRRIFVPAVIALFTTALLFALSCFYDVSNVFSWGVEGLARRATNDTTDNSGSSFVNNKLYLIVIFVGLLVVVILGVMLSAWCCRGAFENPCCCPCYLCACCGGLACLECIGCGLCAAGVEEIV